MLSRRQIFSWQFTAAILLQGELRPSQAFEAIGPYGAREVALVVLCGLTASEISDPRVARAKGIAEVMRKLRAGLDRLADHYDIQVAPVTDQQIEAELVRRKANALMRMQIESCREAEIAYDRCNSDENDFFRGWSNKQNATRYRVVTRGPLLETFQKSFSIGRRHVFVMGAGQPKRSKPLFLLDTRKRKERLSVELDIDMEATQTLLVT